MIIDKAGFVALCKHRDEYEATLEELVNLYRETSTQVVDGVECGVDVNEVSFPAVIILGSYTSDYGMDGVYLYNTVTFVSVDKILEALDR